MVAARARLWRALLPAACAVALAGCDATASQGAPSPPAVAPTATVTAIASAVATALPTPTLTVAPTATERPPATPTSALGETPASTHSANPKTAYPMVAIDPGHGGEDLGARRWVDDKMVLTEAQVNLDLGLRVRDLLEARGIPVFLTRDADYALLEPRTDINDSGEADYVDEAQARVDAINASDAVVLLSIHQNAFEWPDGSLAPDVGGTVVYYCADRPFADQSLELATLVHEEIVAAFGDLRYDIQDRGVEDDYSLKEPSEPGEHLILLGPESDRIVRPSRIPGALSETLFITNAVEGDMASDPTALDRLATAYADALQRYLDEYVSAH